MELTPIQIATGEVEYEPAYRKGSPEGLPKLVTISEVSIDQIDKLFSAVQSDTDLITIYTGLTEEQVKYLRPKSFLYILEVGNKLNLPFVTAYISLKMGTMVGVQKILDADLQKKSGENS
jgi:hypothetical protein